MVLELKFATEYPYMKFYCSSSPGWLYLKGRKKQLLIVTGSTIFGLVRNSKIHMRPTLGAIGNFLVKEFVSHGIEDKTDLLPVN